MKTIGRRAAAAMLCAVLGAGVAYAQAPKAAAPKLEQAVVAGGCYWCMEHDMKLPGVVSVEPGYTGGKEAHPSYEQVGSETTGHHEAVRVTFDPTKTSYAFIMSRYWKLIDPTDAGGQFCDRGPSYAPAVFVANDAQRKVAEQSKAQAAKELKAGKMLTPILPLGPFWPAEEYQRDYARRHALAYAAYRQGCGRDARLSQVWGKAG